MQGHSIQFYDKMKAKNSHKIGVILMPWRSKTVEKIREEFVQAAALSNNFSSLCREFGITRKTGKKWVERALLGYALSDRSRAPHSVPGRTSEETEKLIVDLRLANPGFGAKKIRTILEKQGTPNLPCIKTVNNILNRYGLISPEESLKHKPYVRFERDKCNDLWQTDFKGEFKTADGNYCFPLDIIDDHSRFLIKISAFKNTQNVVISTFREAFYEFGMPRSVLSDNGGQFAGFRHGFTRFEKWLMDHDVLPVHGRVKHPQTQGKIERFHRSMKSELLNHTVFDDVSDAQRQLREWGKRYNEVRPHEALGMRCPSEVYVPSERQYCDSVKPFEYDPTYHLIKVNKWGYVRFAHFQIFLSETFVGDYIQFRPNPDGNSFLACYRNFIIAEFSTHDGKLIHRSISRM